MACGKRCLSSKECGRGGGLSNLGALTTKQELLLSIDRYGARLKSYLEVLRVYEQELLRETPIFRDGST